MSYITYSYKNRVSLFLGIVLLFVLYKFVDIPLAKIINNGKYINNLSSHIIVYIPNIIILITLILTLIIILLQDHIKISKSHMFILHIFNGSICASFINNIIRHIIGKIDLKHGLINSFSSSSYGFVPFSSFSGMPSGHSTVIAVITTSIILFYPRRKILAIFICCLVISSLLLTNSHYLSDCIAGIILGSLISLYTFKYGGFNG